MTLLYVFQKALDLWAELVRHMPEAKSLLAPLNQARDDWGIYDYRLYTFRARVRFALEYKTRRVQKGLWVPNQQRLRAARIPRVCEILEDLIYLVKRLVCGAALASLKIDGAEAGPNRQGDDRVSSDQTGSALKQLELLVGELIAS